MDTVSPCPSIPEDIFARIMFFCLYDGSEFSPYLQPDDLTGLFCDFRSLQASFMRTFSTVSRSVRRASVMIFWKCIFLLSDGDVHAFLSILEEPPAEAEPDYGGLCRRLEVRICGPYDPRSLAALIKRLPKLRVFILRNAYDPLHPVFRHRPIAIVDALVTHSFNLTRAQFESRDEEPNFGLLKTLLGSLPHLTTLHLDRLCVKPLPDDPRPFDGIAPALRVLSLGHLSREYAVDWDRHTSPTLFDCLDSPTALPALNTLFVYEHSVGVRRFLRQFGTQIRELGFGVFERGVAQGEGGHLTSLCPSLEQMTCVAPEALSWQVFYAPPPVPSVTRMTAIYINPQPTILSLSANALLELLSSVLRHKGSLEEVSIMAPREVRRLFWLPGLCNSLRARSVRVLINSLRP